MKTMYSGIGLNNKKSQLFGAFSAGILLLSAGLLHAQTTAGLIDVDFNGNSVGDAYAGGGVSTGPTQSGAALIGSAGDVWNGITDAQLGWTDGPNTINGPLSASGLALNYADGSASGVSMSLTVDGSYDANEPSWSNTSAFTTAGSPYSNLMQDLIFANSARSITLSGLAANQTFDLVLYNAGDQNVGAGRTSSFTVNGVTQTSDWDGLTSTLVAGVDYVNYASATSDGSGNLVINLGPGAGATEGDLDGFQLLAVPEPSTWAMLAIGGVMLLGYRRSFRRA
jgi:PEP-CTERM motif